MLLRIARHAPSPFAGRAGRAALLSSASGDDDTPPVGPPAGESAKAFMERKWDRTRKVADGLASSSWPLSPAALSASLGSSGGQSQAAWPTDRPLTDTVELPVDNPLGEPGVLQPHWQSLERRVTGRKPRKDGKTGRLNIRKSEEDYWLEAGVYSEPAATGDTGGGGGDGGGDALPSSAAVSAGTGDTAGASAAALPYALSTNHAAVAAAAGALPPGTFVRHSTVAVRSPEAAQLLAAAYASALAPAQARLAGFVRASLFHDPTAGTVHAWAAWRSADAASAAAGDPAYAAGVGAVAAHFGGPPAVAELTVLGDFAGQGDGGDEEGRGGEGGRDAGAVVLPGVAAVAATGGAEEEAAASVGGLAVPQLRAALAARGLPVAGLKSQLRARLTAAVLAAAAAVQ
jgi:hypothetical protein